MNIAKQATIALLTDFGSEDGYVGAMKGRILTEFPGTTLVDISHAIRPYDIRQAAFCLNNSYPYFPEKTVFVVVVDPGVGTSRQGIVIKTSQYYFVGPDNGVFSYVFHREGYQAFRIDLNALPDDIANTFHGRDVFAPTVCRILLEPDVSDWAEPTDLPTPINPFATGEQGQVIYVDHFGNLITNLRLKSAPARNLGIGNQIIPFASTFAEVPEGTPLAYIGSSGLVEIAIRNGHAANTFASLNNNQPPIGMECVILSS